MLKVRVQVKVLEASAGNWSFCTSMTSLRATMLDFKGRDHLGKISRKYRISQAAKKIDGGRIAPRAFTRNVGSKSGIPRVCPSSDSKLS
jgi:hypothetical protein